MKDYLNSLLRYESDPMQGRNLVREYLQARILGSLQSSGAMLSLAFHGGTALRFLYQYERFSEDLDFALERKIESYDFRQILKAIRNDLTPEGYDIQLKLNDKKTVQSAFIRFSGLLYELGLSPHADQVLAVKIEVDTNPPAGAKLETSVVRRFQLLQLQHHDKSSLFAGKLHALLQRSYTKGRDFFDLFWYLSAPNFPEPNLIMLNNALRQSGWTKPALNEKNWQSALQERLKTVDWEKAISDVKPFLRPNFNMQLLTIENLDKLLINKKSG